MAVASVWTWWWNNARPIGETIKAWAEIIAYVSASLFLFWKFASGYFVTDLSMKLTTVRQPSQETGMDWLAVTVALKKGERSALRLLDGKIRFTTYPGGLPIDTKPLLGIGRLDYDELPATGSFSIVFKPSPDYPFLNLPPGDETELASACYVPETEPILIEAVVLGRVYVRANVLGRIRSKLLPPDYTGQWRATSIAVPVKQTAPTDAAGANRPKSATA
jgi:hypothetical protein